MTKKAMINDMFFLGMIDEVTARRLLNKALKEKVEWIYITGVPTKKAYLASRVR